VLHGGIRFKRPANCGRLCKTKSYKAHGLPKRQLGKTALSQSTSSEGHKKIVGSMHRLEIVHMLTHHSKEFFVTLYNHVEWYSVQFRLALQWSQISFYFPSDSPCFTRVAASSIWLYYLIIVFDYTIWLYYLIIHFEYSIWVYYLICYLNILLSCTILL
jgi:hypothetical protein